MLKKLIVTFNTLLNYTIIYRLLNLTKIMVSYIKYVCCYNSLSIT